MVSHISFLNQQAVAKHLESNIITLFLPDSFSVIGHLGHSGHEVVEFKIFDMRKTATKHLTLEWNIYWKWLTEMATSWEKVKPLGWNVIDNPFHYTSLSNVTCVFTC